MKRVLILGQAGTFGEAWCQHAAARLAQRLEVPCVPASDAAPPKHSRGWVATASVGALSRRLMHSADTAIWLQFQPLAVTRAWAGGLRAKLVGAAHAPRRAKLADVRDSLFHMACTPHMHRLLRHPALAHLQIFHLRSPEEADFWLRVQEHRLPPGRPGVPQPA
jgi:hypothetical protein